jgi:hypothetical protein
MRRDAAAHDRVPMTVITNFGMLLNEGAHKVASGIAPFVLGRSAAECCFGRGLITTPASRQKDDRRK